MDHAIIAGQQVGRPHKGEHAWHLILVLNGPILKRAPLTGFPNPGRLLRQHQQLHSRFCVTPRIRTAEKKLLNGRSTPALQKAQWSWSFTNSGTGTTPSTTPTSQEGGATGGRSIGLASSRPRQHSKFSHSRGHSFKIVLAGAHAAIFRA